MPRKKTYYIFSISLLFALASIAVFTLMFMALKKKNESASALSQNIQSSSNQEENIATLKKNIQTTNEARNRVNSFIVNENSIETFVSWMEDQGNNIALDVTVKNVDLLPKKKNTLAVSMETKGSFDQVMHFINMIQYAPYQILITSTSLTSAVKAPTLASQSTPESKKEEPVYEWNLQIGFEVTSYNPVKN